VAGRVAHSTNGTPVITQCTPLVVAASRDERLDRHRAFDGLRGYANLVREALIAWSDHRASSRGAGITLLAAATSVFAELKDSLDIIWGQKSPPRSGIVAIVRGRLLSFGLILTLGFLLLVSLVASASLDAPQKYWNV
jgi:membrane protein